MNLIKDVMVLFVLALAVGRSFGTSTEGSSQTEAKPVSSADLVETEIKRLEQVEVKAFLERDVATLSKLWDAKYVVNNPDNKVVAGVAPEKRPGLQKPRNAMSRVVEHLTVRENLVISMGRETIKPGEGEPNAGKTVHRRYTHVWERAGKDWKLIARHANVFRVDP